MRYLLDSEILKWNDRLEKTPFRVYPKSNFQGSHPHISFRQKTLGDLIVETIDPHLNNYQFVFSVAKNRVDNFFDIYNNLKEEDFGTKTCHTGRDNTDKISDIIVNENIVVKKESKTHKISEKEYVRYSYTFTGKISQIMAYVFYLEDTIEFFSKIWGYNEDGTEEYLINYPIGTLVSDVNDKSKDYLILDYIYRKVGSNYYVDYELTEVLGGYSSVIKYGDVKIMTENNICFSRNGRIDDILN
jgi:hypothetical protein